MSRLVLDGADYRSLCFRVYTRDKWRCRVCKGGQNLTAHHIVFRSHGGDDATWNLITLCNQCHDGVHSGNGVGHLVIMPKFEGSIIDADGDVRFSFVGGWRPK